MCTWLRRTCPRFGALVQLALVGLVVVVTVSPAQQAPKGLSATAFARPAADPDAHKLLEGIFSDPVAAGQLLFTPGLLWEAATKDAASTGETPAAYLARVTNGCVSFLEEAEEDGIPRIVNHESSLNVLRELGNDLSKGVLTLLTGPRSVGKSLMLHKVAAELNKDVQRPRRMFVFDARRYGADLTGGIISYLTAANNNKLLEFAQALARGPVGVALTVAAKFAAPLLFEDQDKVVHVGVTGLVDDVVKLSRDRLSAAVPLDGLLDVLFAACAKAGQRPILVIDEANHALATSDPELKRRTLDLLQQLTRVTKQHREATVVLATSEHGLPFRLRALGYTKGHIGDVIVAEEVPPAVMKDLLVRTWGCGEHLATALLKLYGGHVLHASAALRKLGRAANALHAASLTNHELSPTADPAAMKGTVAIATIVSDPAECLSDRTLDAAGVPQDKRQDMIMSVREAMRALVVDGFVPLDNEADKMAELFSHANVGYVVPDGATAAAVPPHAWAGRTASGERAKAVLLPASHIMRLLLADKAFHPPPSP